MSALNRQNRFRRLTFVISLSIAIAAVLHKAQGQQIDRDSAGESLDVHQGLPTRFPGTEDLSND